MTEQLKTISEKKQTAKVATLNLSSVSLQQKMRDSLVEISKITGEPEPNLSVADFEDEYFAFVKMCCSAKVRKENGLNALENIEGYAKYSRSVSLQPSYNTIDISEYLELKQKYDLLYLELYKEKGTDIGSNCSICNSHLKSDYSICLFCDNCKLCKKCSIFHFHPLLKGNCSPLLERGLLVFIMLSAIYSRPNDRLFSQFRIFLEKNFEIESKRKTFAQVYLDVCEFKMTEDSGEIKVTVSNKGSVIVYPGSWLICSNSNNLIMECYVENAIETDEAEECTLYFELPKDFCSSEVKLSLMHPDQVIVTLNECTVMIKADEDKQKSKIVENILVNFPQIDKEKLLDILNTKK